MVKYLLGKLVWSVKQLLPLKYKSHYSGKPVEWRMWFGKCFNIQ